MTIKKIEKLESRKPPVKLRTINKTITNTTHKLKNNTFKRKNNT